LTYLSNALGGKDFTIEKQRKITITTDGDASFIKAVLSIFPGIQHLLCCLHYLKNIMDKLQFKLPDRTSEKQCKGILLLFNGKYPVKGLLDMTNDEIKRDIHKVYEAWYVYLMKLKI
jgi:hypothetical protein